MSFYLLAIPVEKESLFSCKFHTSLEGSLFHYSELPCLVQLAEGICCLDWLTQVPCPPPSRSGSKLGSILASWNELKAGYLAGTNSSGCCLTLELAQVMVTAASAPYQQAFIDCLPASGLLSALPRCPVCQKQQMRAIIQQLSATVGARPLEMCASGNSG